MYVTKDLYPEYIKDTHTYTMPGAGGGLNQKSIIELSKIM